MIYDCFGRCWLDFKIFAIALSHWKVVNLWSGMTGMDVEKIDDNDASTTPHDWAHYLSDGLHLSPAGNAFVFDELRAKIENGQMNHGTIPPHNGFARCLNTLRLLQSHRPCRHLSLISGPADPKEMTLDAPWWDKIDQADIGSNFS